MQVILGTHLLFAHLMIECIKHLPIGDKLRDKVLRVLMAFEVVHDYVVSKAHVGEYEVSECAPKKRDLLAVSEQAQECLALEVCLNEVPVLARIFLVVKRSVCTLHQQKHSIT